MNKYTKEYITNKINELYPNHFTVEFPENYNAKKFLKIRCNICGYEMERRFLYFCNYSKTHNMNESCPKCKATINGRKKVKINDGSTAKDTRKHLIYKITNNINKKIYIGKHSTNNIYDSYMGSGAGIKAAIRKYGIEHFTKEILFCFDTEQQAVDKEHEIINEDFVKRKDTYNDFVGGFGACSGKQHPLFGKVQTLLAVEKASNKRGVLNSTHLVSLRKAAKAKELSVEIIEDICKRVKNNETMRSISNLYNISTTTVRKYAKRGNVYHKKESDIKERIKSMLAYVKKHPAVSNKQLSTLFNLDAHTMHKYRNGGITCDKKESMSLHTYDKIIDRTKNGDSVSTIVKEDHIPETTVRRVIDYFKAHPEDPYPQHIKKRNYQFNMNFINECISVSGRSVNKIAIKYNIPEARAYHLWRQYKAEMH